MARSVVAKTMTSREASTTPMPLARWKEKNGLVIVISSLEQAMNN